MAISLKILDDLDAAQAAIDATNQKHFDTLVGLVAQACQRPDQIVPPQVILDRIPEGFTLTDLRAAVEARLAGGVQ